MLLSEYIQANSMTSKSFLSALEPFLNGRKLSLRTVESWRQGKSLPHGTYIKAVSELTENQVTYADFVSGLRPKP